MAEPMADQIVEIPMMEMMMMEPVVEPMAGWWILMVEPMMEPMMEPVMDPMMEPVISDDGSDG